MALLLQSCLRPMKLSHAPKLAAALAVPTLFSLIGCADDGAGRSEVDPDLFPSRTGVSDGGTGTTPSSNPDAGTPANDGGDGGPSGFDYKPVPTGCVTDVSPGVHTFTCEGLTVDVGIPDMQAKCPPAGCGLIVELHGDTGTGPLVDAHTRLLTRGPSRGYIVLAPTGPAIGALGIPPVVYPGSSWNVGTDAKLLAITQTFTNVFKADPKRLHLTGFSRGGFTSWRLACDNSELFASVAVGGAGNSAVPLGSPFSTEPTCFDGNHYPTRPFDILMLMGRTDTQQYAKMTALRTSARARYGLVDQDTVDVVGAVPSLTHQRASHVGKATIEWFDHAYEVDPTNSDPYGKGAKGHCIPGSDVAKSAPLYNIACKKPNDVDWGAEVLAFFDMHPKR